MILKSIVMGIKNIKDFIKLKTSYVLFILTFLLLLIGLAASVYLSQQSQELRGKAANERLADVTGLRGTYYNNINVCTRSSRSGSRVDPQINFEWVFPPDTKQAGYPPSEAFIGYFSARWTGTLIPKGTGEYSFNTYTNDGVRLWVDGKLIIQNWRDNSSSEVMKNTGKITFSEVKEYPILMEYFGTGGFKHTAKLTWQSDFFQEEAVPQANLFPSSSACPALSIPVYAKVGSLCKEYLNPCDVPCDWERISSCSISPTISVTSTPTLTPAPTSPTGLKDSDCVLATIPTLIKANEEKSVFVAVKNTGSMTWKSSSSSNARLNEEALPKLGSLDNVWNVNKVNLEKDVKPGEVYFFDFKIKAPSVSGNYPGQWQMVEENKKWFGEKCGPPTVKVENGGEEVIDTLDYFISKHKDKGVGGTHPLSQTVDGNISYYVKFANPQAFEVHKWDDNYIYLVEDHRSAEKLTYNFSNGLWMKRRMKVGEYVFASNKIQWYSFDEGTKKCSKSGIASSYGYSTKLEAHFPKFDLGGGFGVQDVIVLKYDYNGPGSEKFYYSKEWGWVKWELYDNNTLVKTSTFNKPGKLTPPIKSYACTSQ